MKMRNRSVSILVNGTTLACINTNKAVAADYLTFMEAVIGALMHEPSLEHEANASNKTILHKHFGSLGSLPITDPKGPQ